jgi:anti-sigma factor RsiW
MNCEQARDLLEAHADGSLEPAIGAQIDRHLAACEACAARLTRVRSLLDDARRLPRSLDPPRDLWPAIAERLHDRAVVPLVPRRARTVVVPRAWLAAAAVALITVSSGVTALLVRRTSPAGFQHLAALPSSVLVLEREYADAAAEITAVLEAQRDTLPIQAVAALEHSLRVLDHAIGEARAALTRDPGNAELSQLLLATHRHKLDVLKRASLLAGAL